MKLDRFKKKALIKEFPFLGPFFTGSKGEYRYTCECGWSGNWEVDEKFKCPGCSNSAESSRYGITSNAPSYEREQIRPEIKGRNYEEVTVKKVDSNLLKTIPTQYIWVGSVVSISQGEMVHFIYTNSTFRIEYNAVETDYTSGSNYAHDDTYYSDGETVIEAINRLIETKPCHFPNKLRYIVVEHYGIHTTDHHSHGRKLVIYKATKAAGTIAAVIKEMQASAANQVAAESNF